MIRFHELGDCIERMRQIPDDSVDMVFCDLPYGATRCAWDCPLPVEELWEAYRRVVKPDGAILLCATQPFASSLVVSNSDEFRYEWIWEKPLATGHLNAKRQPMRAHESVLVFYRQRPRYDPQKTTGHPRKVSSAKHGRASKQSDVYGAVRPTGYDSTERYPRSVQVFKQDRQRLSIHPTQKPVGLVEYMIRTYTEPGDLVLDNCSGSGTTGVAAIRTGRGYWLIEQDVEYYSAANDRLNAARRSLAASC